ncbi:NAD(P)/FAD-dependent oxidoreductase [Marinivivus vitaminiproducens]|uniref:NAD(P)/FAD-dependent oxidoreductase n=1 Tax=Marinivivus vitaminiproducens TaxID=3035935 RepID=UPI0027A9BCDF|nr:FAD-binding oxidoreductase [Geminicoccaceae bacterium SCSIO 64248]
MADDSIFHPDFVNRPYWWDAAPPEDARETDLPAETDVLIVGSGWCGLSASLELARAGLRVDVLDAGPLGYGASTRSGGMVSSGQKLVLTGAWKVFGEENAARVFETSQETFTFISDLIARENLDADYQHVGRFFGAYVPAHYERLKRNAELLSTRTGVTTRMVPKAEQRGEIGSDVYHGGMVVEDYCGLHPAKYNKAFRDAARQAGAHLHSHSAVRSIARTDKGFVVDSVRGRIAAKEVIVATNGYTDRAVPELRRRVIPVASYIVATEPLAPEVMAEIMPHRRMMSDTRRELNYFRPSPDGTRLLLGCRAGVFDKDPKDAAHGNLARIRHIFPQLARTRLTHAWSGNVAMTFDHVPHMGVSEGVHYAMGCNGNGVAMATYLGHQTALKILGRQNRPCIFDGRPFPTRPYYTGVPWMVPLATAWYHLCDAFDGLRAKAA